MRLRMSFLLRAGMLVYSRPLFRTCEIICNHAARLAEKNGSLADAGRKTDLEALNRLRMELQNDLQRIGGSHGEVCAECRGSCCGGARERDAFTDRVLQDPETLHRAARRRTGQMAAYKVLCARQESPVAVIEGEPVEGYCPELTTSGCRVPYELRPIQCTAYFCNATISRLSDEECRTGIRALAGLMKIQLRTVALALRSRFRRQA